MTLTSLECIVIFFRKYLQLYIKETICRVFILYMKFFELFLSCLPFLNGLDYRIQRPDCAHFVDFAEDRFNSKRDFLAYFEAEIS